MPAGKYLGGGTYGDVYRDGNRAVKRFDSDACLIQEYAAGVYLRGCPHIVHSHSCNIRDLTLTMNLFNGCLKDWMWFKRKTGYVTVRTTAQRSLAARELLKGLACLHDLNLVHGDVTPKNVLCNWDSRGNITKLVVGDLGFLAIEGYARARRTAPAFREEHVQKDYRHDIYSFGVIMLELYGTFKISHQWTSQDLVGFANAYVKDEKSRVAVCSCLNENRELRPTARSLLKSLYGFTPELVKPIQPPKIPLTMSTRDAQALNNLFNDVGDKQLRLHRMEIAYKGCHAFLSKHGIHSNQHIVYGTATLVIYSSIYRHGSFNVEVASKSMEIRKKDLISAIERLLEDTTFIIYLYSV